MTAIAKDSRRRALLVGSPVGGLQGVLNDVSKMRRELEAWGFWCDEVVGDDATRDGILCALRKLVAWANEGEPEAVAIYYSGHGGRCRLVAREGEATGPQWAFLVPVDIEAESGFRGIAEFELAGLLDDLAVRTDNVTVILDCCHSAGLVRGADVVRAQPERVVMPAELHASLVGLAERSRQLHPDGNPKVVRVVATASVSLACENVQPDGRVGGYLTHELCEALAGARRLPMPWETIIGQVRERIMARRNSASQRPEVEGPRGRLPFSLDERPYAGEHSTLVYGPGDAPWVWAGRLHGLSEADRVEIQHTTPEGLEVVATGRLVKVLDDSSRLELDPSADGRRPRAGSVVVPRKLALHKTVRVDPSAIGVAGLVAGITGSPRLAMVEDEKPGDFVVALADGELHVSGTAWVRRAPRPATPDGVAEVVADLEALARSEILLAALESSQGSTAGTSSVHWELEAFVTEPNRETPRPLVPGETVPEGSRIYVEVRSPTRGSPTLYVNVLDRGVAGRLELVNQSEPSGVQLVALDERWVGRRRHGGPPGMRLEWPTSVPKAGDGHEELIVVASERPLDLRSLLEAPKPKRDAEERTRRSETRSDGLGTWLRYAVKRLRFKVSVTVSFDVSPRDARRDAPVSPRGSSAVSSAALPRAARYDAPVSSMSREPLVLVVLVNVDGAPPLPHVEAEAEAIRVALESPPTGKRVAEVRKLRNPTVQGVLSELRSEAVRRRLRVFHFAGHASGVALMLADRAGGPATGHADGLADYLGQQKGSRLVVLNGCSTRAQIDRLRQAGVGAVVATTRAIRDDVGAAFAAQLYAELAGKRLAAAFRATESGVQFECGSNLRELVHDDPDTLEEWGGPSPWVLSIDDLQERWRLPRVDEEALVDMLAEVLRDEGLARTVLTRLRFPVGLIPRFDNSLVFWSEVVEALGNGVLEGEADGVQKLVDVAAAVIRGSAFLEEHRS